MTDWGFSLANRNYVQDSCFRGTSILEDVLKCQREWTRWGVLRVGYFKRLWRRQQCAFGERGASFPNRDPKACLLRLPVPPFVGPV